MSSRSTQYNGSAVTVTFEDHFQDFLEWDIRAGKVVACRPFQAFVWCGLEVHSTPMPGQKIRIRNRTGQLRWINYPIVKVKATRSVKAGFVSRDVLNSKVIASGAKGLIANLQRSVTP